MAPISKKRAAMEMHLCHTLVPSLNMTGYSSDSSNQGGSETSNSSSQNLPIASSGSLAAAAAAAAANSDSPSPLQLSALSSLSALGLASHQPHLNALHAQLNHSQLMSNLSSGLSGLAGAAAAAVASSVGSSSTTSLSGSHLHSGSMMNTMSNTMGSASNAGGNSSGSEQSGTLGKQYAKVNRVVLDKNSDEYRRRRERNNLAVKKSRTKSKLKTLQTLERVKQLKAENEELIQKIDILTKELRLLKDLFVAHASNAHGANITEIDLALLTSSEALQEVPLNLNGKFNGLFSHHH